MQRMGIVGVFANVIKGIRVVVLTALVIVVVNSILASLMALL